jgi:hypothetical protein
MIFRTVVEEIVVRSDLEKKALQFTIHWKGGTHTQLTMERPRSATENATPIEALEIIRRMAVRHGDDQIASVLNRLRYSTGKGKRWNQLVWLPPDATTRLVGKASATRSGESKSERSGTDMWSKSSHNRALSGSRPVEA